MTFQDILAKYRAVSFSERDKGDRFERLMQAFLQTVPWYAGTFRHIWLWREFPYKRNLGGNDTGIDLVAHNDWAEEQGKPRYILDLLLSVISVSVKTVHIVKGLP